MSFWRVVGTGHWKSLNVENWKPLVQDEVSGGRREFGGLVGLSLELGQRHRSV